MRILKKLGSVLVIFVTIGFPMRTDAAPAPLLDFGGTNDFSIECTCSDGVYWSFFAPLFLSAEPMAGPISYVSEGTELFDSYVPPIDSGAEYNGEYFPGVPSCWMEAGETCVPLEDYGTIILTGTSPD